MNKKRQVDGEKLFGGPINLEFRIWYESIKEIQFLHNLIHGSMRGVRPSMSVRDESEKNFTVNFVLNIKSNGSNDTKISNENLRIFLR